MAEVAALADLPHVVATTRPTPCSAALDEPGLIEYRTDRADNVRKHRELFATVAGAALSASERSPGIRRLMPVEWSASPLATLTGRRRRCGPARAASRRARAAGVRERGPGDLSGTSHSSAPLDRGDLAVVLGADGAGEADQ